MRGPLKLGQPEEAVKNCCKSFSFFIRRALTRAEELPTETHRLTNEDVPPPNIELLRAFIATAVLFLFFPQGKQELIECLTGDLVTSKQRGVIMNRRDRKG
jgi:hypothetical protein